MARAFPSKLECDVPSTPAIYPDDYAFDSCGVPSPPSSAFSGSSTPSVIPQPSPVGGGNCLVGYLVVGVITAVQEDDGPPSNHKYKAEDCHGCISIDEWTTPINALVRPEDAVVGAAAVYDNCLLGYWCGTKVLVVWEGPASGGDVFGVDLAVAGGSAGSATAQCSYTYDVSHAITGSELGDAIDPTSGLHKWVRPTVGYMIYATYGHASYDDNGDLVIGWINEVADQESCGGDSGYDQGTWD